jgi:hypothetical protein
MDEGLASDRVSFQSFLRGVFLISQPGLHIQLVVGTRRRTLMFYLDAHGMHVERCLSMHNLYLFPITMLKPLYSSAPLDVYGISILVRELGSFWELELSCRCVDRCR